MKLNLKEKAIKLRKKGLTYSEILKQVPVAKSTLSLWLRDVGLSKPQKQKLSKKRLEAGRRGGIARRQQRIEKTKKIQEKAIKDVGTISERELWLMGTMLYWAEGRKQNSRDTSAMLEFGNSDPKMIQIYLKWLKKFLNVRNEDMVFRLQIHENSRNRIDDVVKFWSDNIGFSKNRIGESIYYKKHNPKTVRKNIGNDYRGLLLVRVKKSTDLNRKVTGWIKGVCQKI
jgi:hypothetical protein